MSLPVLVAHYLAANYPAALDSFLHASGQPAPDLSRPPHPDLRTLVEDYVSAHLAREIGDVAIHDEPISADGSWRGWKSKDVIKLDLAQDVSLSRTTRSIQGITAANLLTVDVRHLPKRHFDLASASYQAEYTRTIMTTSVDRSMKLIDYDTGEVDRVLEPHKAAILAFAVHPTNPRYLLTASMDGTTVLSDLVTQTTLQTFRSLKFVVRATFSPDGQYFATASYDRNVVVYRATTSALSPPLDEDAMPLDDGDDPNLACDPSLRFEECHRVSTESNPEALVFVEDYLLYTLRSSHVLYYLRLDAWTTSTKSFNPHPMDTHVSFSVLNLALHPSGKVIACQTGDHRAGSGERILIYGVAPEETERLACLWTGGETDDFVLPRMAWLPDGTGLITTTANGYLNLVSMNGQVRSELKVHGAMDMGLASSEIVRDCCVVQDTTGWEVVSVGYDRQIRFSR